MSTTDKKIADVLAKFGEPMAGNVWRVQGTAVIYHKTLERIAAMAKIKFDEPKIIRAERDEAVIQVTGRLIEEVENPASASGLAVRLLPRERVEWSLGEALIGVNYRVSGKQAAYVYAMAEKRAKDRVILKLIELSGLVYSEEEADDFREGGPQEPQAPEPPDSDAILASERPPEAPTGGQGSGAAAVSAPEPTPNPPEEPTINFAFVLAEIKEQLTYVKDAKHVPEVAAQFVDEYNQMTRSQRSVVDGLYQDKERLLRAAAEETGRQRVEDAGGKGVKQYMDEDRGDAALAGTVERQDDPFDASGAERWTDPIVISRVRAAATAVKDRVTAERLLDFMQATKPRRAAMTDMDVRRSMVRQAQDVLTKHGL